MLPFFLVASLFLGLAADARGDDEKKTPLQRLKEKLFEQDWSVGDQGFDDGAVVKIDGCHFLVFIEGWGPECVEEDRLTSRTRKKLEAAKKAWMADQADRNLFDEIFENDDVTYAVLLLRPDEIESAIYTRDDEAFLDYDAEDGLVSDRVPTTTELARYVDTGGCYDYAHGVSRRFGLKVEMGAYVKDGKLLDHAWTSTSDGTIVDTTHGQFDPSVPILVARPGTPEHARYLRAEDMTDAQRRETYGPE